MLNAIHVATVTRSYGSVYHTKIQFDLEALGVGPSSWLWLLLKDIASDSLVTAIEGESIRNMRIILLTMVGNSEVKSLLSQTPKQTSTIDIRRLFILSEELFAGKDTATASRGRATLRTNLFLRSHRLGFAESIDPQRVRFKPKRPTFSSDPRPLISDLHDIADPNTELPVGALVATSVKNYVVAVKERTEYDLKKIRTACIADMEAAAELRKRAATLRQMPIAVGHLTSIRRAMLTSNRDLGELRKKRVLHKEVLIGVLKIIHDEALTRTAVSGIRYEVPYANIIRTLFLDGLQKFTSRKIFEIEYFACVEELFAAFQLIHTYSGWNWSATTALRADGVEFGKDGTVLLQSFKSKTDDDTPVHSLDLSEPGIQMAIEIILWNRRELVSSGLVEDANQMLWVARPALATSQRPGYFHPITRLKDFIKRHALPSYTLEQVRTQVLFNTSLTKGGVEAARMKGGHRSYGTTQRYVGNIIQDRISSAMNLEFSKKLETEIQYLYQGGERYSGQVVLLKAIGDGSSCTNPKNPPHGRSKSGGNC